LDVANQERLADIKQIIDGLPNGNTKIFLNMRTGEKITTLALPRSVRLSPTTTNDFNALGVKVGIE